MLYPSRPRRGPGRNLGAALLASALLSPAWAEDGALAEREQFRVSGFATLGATYHDNDDLGVISDFSQRYPARQGWSGRLDSVLGLQLEWMPAEHTSLLLQGVARSGRDMEGEVRMAYLRQQFGQDVAVRVGRIRSPLYFDSDVSEIGYAYLQVRPPMPLYSVASNVRHIDGGDLQFRHVVGNAALLMQLYYGESRYTQHFYNLDGQRADARLNDIRGVAVTAALPNVQLRASRTWVKRYTLRSPAVSQLNAGLDQLAGGLMAMADWMPAFATQAGQVAAQRNPYDNKPVYTSVGFDANVDNLRVLGEWATFDSRRTMVGKYEGYHLTVGYSLGDFTPYLSYSRWDRKGARYRPAGLHPTGIDPMLDGGLQQMGEALAMAASYADISSRSITAGVRWDLRENMAMKFQFDRFRTAGRMTPGNFAVQSLPVDHTVNMFTAALDIVF